MQLSCTARTPARPMRAKPHLPAAVYPTEMQTYAPQRNNQPSKPVLRYLLEGPATTAKAGALQALGTCATLLA